MTRTREKNAVRAQTFTCIEFAISVKSQTGNQNVWITMIKSMIKVHMKLFGTHSQWVIIIVEIAARLVT